MEYPAKFTEITGFSTGKKGYVLGYSSDRTTMYVRPTEGSKDKDFIHKIPISVLGLYTFGNPVPESERLPEDNGPGGFDLPETTPVFKGGSRRRLLRRPRLKRKTTKRR